MVVLGRCAVGLDVVQWCLTLCGGAWTLYAGGAFGLLCGASVLVVQSVVLWSWNVKQHPIQKLN